MKHQGKSLLVHPPAKVNLVLRILDRLPNGYHSLWSLMQTISLADELEIHLNPSAKDIHLECIDGSMPLESNNLVCRAADLVLKKADIRIGLHLRLKKHIPVGAGLGGGSSDAASTIMGLNHLLALGWSTHEMSKLGQELGSDIPFFFDAPTALVRGWGDQIMPLQLQDYRWFVLVNPGFPIYTETAYQRLDKSRNSTPPLTKNFLQVEEAECITWEGILSCMVNDFEEILFVDFPVLAHIKARLLETGAEAALLSGTGATVFGVFLDQRIAERARELLAMVSGWQVYVVSSQQIRLFERRISVNS